MLFGANRPVPAVSPTWTGCANRPAEMQRVMPAAPGKAGQWETAPARADNQKDWLPAAAGLRAGVSVGQRKSARNQLRIRGEGVATPTAPMFLCSDRAAGWSEKQVLIRRSTTPVSGSPQRPWQPPTGLGSPPVARGRGDSSDRTCLVFLRAQRPGVQRRRRAPLICAAQGSPEGGAESRLLGWILALMWAPTHPFCRAPSRALGQLSHHKGAPSVVRAKRPAQVVGVGASSNLHPPGPSSRRPSHSCRPRPRTRACKGWPPPPRRETNSERAWGSLDRPCHASHRDTQKRAAAATQSRRTADSWDVDKGGGRQALLSGCWPTDGPGAEPRSGDWPAWTRPVRRVPVADFFLLPCVSLLRWAVAR